MTGLLVHRERIWGQYKRPKENILVKLPADNDSQANYLKKGFVFIRFGSDDIPMATVNTSVEEIKKIVPEKVIEKVSEKKPVKSYTCEKCGVVFTHHLALAGHKSKHRKEEGMI